MRRRRLAPLKNCLAAIGRIAKVSMQSVSCANKIRLRRWQADGGLEL
jgi:hypothetical protein